MNWIVGAKWTVDGIDFCFSRGILSDKENFNQGDFGVWVDNVKEEFLRYLNQQNFKVSDVDKIEIVIKRKKEEGVL